ncbi:hypothetical protein KC19_9G104500 [Ceratodon purpureus]|uniref:Uncharacterized protein n=1 Tax=Ceratodon purpureus TaxID=3225 RepID=A0A8T0GW56_CERPU|nr:hypothetical protein KC19_9G104500 [Ceratodon purpureus]
MPTHGPQHRYAQAPIAPVRPQFVLMKTSNNHTYWRAIVSRNQRREVTAYIDRKWTKEISAVPARLVSEVLKTQRNGRWIESRPTQHTHAQRFVLMKTSNNHTYWRAIVSINQRGEVTAYIDQNWTKEISAVPARLVSEVHKTQRNGHWIESRR